MIIANTKNVKLILVVVLTVLTKVSSITVPKPTPRSVDWQKSGLTTPVKNQGYCDCGYSFAVAAALEGQAIKLLGDRTDLSNQQIIDCSISYGNMGCEGGSPGAAFDYVRDVGGLTSFASYPFTGRVGTCRVLNPLVSVTGHKRHVQTTPQQLKTIVSTIGPVVVAMYASAPELKQYSGGIFTTARCKNTQMNQLNHYATLVGYGEENGVKYWKIKNSWGPQWGEAGYFRIHQDFDCGVTLDVYTPVV